MALFIPLNNKIMPEIKKTIEKNQITPEITETKKKKFDLSLNFLKSAKNKKNIDALKLSKYIYPFTIGIICLVVIWFMYFLYQTVYLTMAEARFVIALKGDLLGEQIDKKKFEKITEFINNWRQKEEQLKDSGNLPNIFQYRQSTPTTSTENNLPTN